MKRPDFDIALTHWGDLIRQRELSSNIIWVFRENLFNAEEEQTQDLKLIFETKINPVTLDDVRLVYNQAKSYAGPIVFWMLVGTQDFSLCTLLGDTLSTCDDIFVDEWNLYFFTKEFYLSFEEVTRPAKWAEAKRHERNHLSELDYVFCLNAFRPSSNQVREAKRK